MGAAMLVRSIVPADEAAYRAILEGTSAEDRYCRFFHIVDHFDPEEVHRFVETRPDMIGMIAFDGATALGAAHAALIDDDSAELAVVVARDARRRGVGTALMDALIARLRERSVRHLIASALRENHPFERLAKHAGFHVERADGAAFRWVLALEPAGDAAKPMSARAFAAANGIRICHETFGDRANPPMILIMGLATQMIVWDDAFCALLAARGFWVIRFDNRDIGESTRFPNERAPKLPELMLAHVTGLRFRAPYTLHDMAADTVGLLDALGAGSAHVVGASMGGAIAQELAIEYPDRVRSLTSIMSSTGDPKLPGPQPKALARLAKRSRSTGPATCASTSSPGRCSPAIISRSTPTAQRGRVRPGTTAGSIRPASRVRCWRSSLRGTGRKRCARCASPRW